VLNLRIASDCAVAQGNWKFTQKSPISAKTYHRGRSRAPRRHAYTDPGAPQLPEPTYAERVRTLVSLGTIATLSTVSRKRPGYPFGSLMPYAIDGNGRPIFLISNMAMHTQNLQADPRASLFVGQAGDGDPLGTARATLIGDVLPVLEEEVGDTRERYLSRYENSRSWVDFKDFEFYRMQPLDIYYVGGFGVMGWVTAEDYQAAKVDPLAEAAPRILGHMNADHVTAMILLAKVHAGLDASEATMTAVDRLGFHLRLKTADGIKGTRINFLREVQTSDETRKVLVEMVRAAEPSA
jgi:putative heme iron utilization protein